jgi:hypothetical protein
MNSSLAADLEAVSDQTKGGVRLGTTKPVFSALGAPMSPARVLMSRNWHFPTTGSTQPTLPSVS